jgi:hypothetical protein
MTEEEWLASTDSDQMLAYLLFSGKASNRKRGLYAVASYRRVWHLFHNERSRKAVEATERHADGAASREEVEAAWDAAEAAGAGGLGSHLPVYAALQGADEVAAKCHLLRCIFGNPFHFVTLFPAWRTAQVPALARAAYDRRDLPSGTLDVARLAVLADALEEAGCDQPDLLDHLRGPGPTFEGAGPWTCCWGRGRP